MAHPKHLDDPSQLPAILKKERLRQKTDIQWKDLADAAGVTYQSLQAFEDGAPLTWTTLRPWLRKLGLPEEWARDWRDWRIQQQNEELMKQAGLSETDKQLHRLQWRQSFRIRNDEGE